MDVTKSHVENAPNDNSFVNNSLGDPPDTLVPEGLSAKHCHQLHVESGISYDVIATTGYRSIFGASELTDLGFSPSQARTAPGLLIPAFGIDGRPVAPEFRADNPLDLKKKYISPPRSHNALGVSPLSLEHLQNPAVPLLFTEGAKKRDAILSHITDDTLIVPVSLKGVWGWRGTNEEKGKTAIPDFESIALNDRLTYLCFDSDAMEKSQVHTALSRFKAFLKSKGAKVKIIYLPPYEDRSKVGADDYLVADHTLSDMLKLASDELRPIANNEPARTANGIPYSQSKSGRVEESQHNLELMLTHEPEWTGRLAYNVFRQVVELDRHPIKSVDRAAISSWGSTNLGISGGSTKVRDQAIAVIASRNARDPLQDYVNNLPTWDGTPRLEGMLTSYCGATDSTVNRWIARMLLSSMIARALDPGGMCRYCVVLEGKESIGKTELARALGGDWYVSLTTSLDSKDAALSIQGCWLCEIEEMNTIRKSTREKVKSFVSARVDYVVPKFSNDREGYPRRNIFLGTTNDTSYLPSESGDGSNTRWFPVAITYAKVEKLKRDRDQLMAEAKDYYLRHQNDWWLIPDEIKAALSDVRNARLEENVYEEKILDWLELHDKAETHWEEVAVDCLELPTERWTRQIQMQVGDALRRLGWTKGARKRVEALKGGRTKRIVPWCKPSILSIPVHTPNEEGMDSITYRF